MSTTIPSGSFRPSLTMVFKSEPSEFDERTRPAARSKKYKRLTVFADNFAISDLEALEDGIGFFISFLVLFRLSSELQQNRSLPFQRGSHESAEAGNGLAENQVLHLKRAFVGVERFGIVEEARHVVVCDYAVSAQQLPGPGHRLSTLGRAEGLRKRRVRVGHFPFRLQLSQANQQALRGSNIGSILERRSWTS